MKNVLFILKLIVNDALLLEIHMLLSQRHIRCSYFKRIIEIKFSNRNIKRRSKKNMKNLRKYSILKSIDLIVQIQGFMNLNLQKVMKRQFYDIDELLRKRSECRLIGIQSPED